jgi:prepilin-type N-terminal cleavage/methylation domain-containing protein
MIRRLSGFTLIELLIVVAIIAILAAIAVPNFLEAQTRAKVSRVKNDQRSLATGIESYYVDNNSYPAHDSSTGTHKGADPKSRNKAKSSDQVLQTPTFAVRTVNTDVFLTLTTPVAYITQLIPDPFADSKGISFRYSSDVSRGGWFLWSFGPDLDEKDSSSTKAGDCDLVLTLGITGVSETIYSANKSVPLVNLVNVTYDPTNGTNSNGDVWRAKQ